MFDKLMSVLSAINQVFVSGEFIMLLIYAVFVFVGFYILKIIRNGTIQFSEILLGPDNKVSVTKLTQIGAFSISTWGFAFFIINGQLSEWYFSMYMLAWAGSTLANKFLVNKGYTDTIKANNPPNVLVKKE